MLTCPRGTLLVLHADFRPRRVPVYSMDAPRDTISVRVVHTYNQLGRLVAGCMCSRFRNVERILVREPGRVARQGKVKGQELSVRCCEEMPHALSKTAPFAAPNREKLGSSVAAPDMLPQWLAT